MISKGIKVQVDSIKDILPRVIIFRNMMVNMEMYLEIYV